jgi:NitT/TauT family transport system ATP-binding protein
MTSALEVRNVAKSYGTGATAKQVLSDISVDVRRGELVCIVGPSGAGKTTLLRCLSGLHQPTSGEVLLNGTRVDGPPEQLAVVFQDYSRSLLPWMKVAANVEFPLLEKKMSKADRKALVEEMLTAVGLQEHSGKYPRQLSGGMQQRVAIARALAYRPSVLLMDEPFASLDAQTRAELEDVVLELRDEYGVTIVFVTHDIDEAVYLGDRVVVLSGAPATVSEIVDVALPSPRDQVTTKALSEFGALRTDVLTRIRAAKQA